MSLLWCGFAVVWEAMALSAKGRSLHGPPDFFPLFGVAAIAIALYALVGRFFYKAWRNRRTFYAVTNRRVLVLTEGLVRSLQAGVIQGLPTIQKRVRADGSGTLRFGDTSGFGGFAAMYENSGMEFFASFRGTPPVAFYDVKDAETVYQLVLQQRPAP
jgi:hypothetical protein